LRHRDGARIGKSGHMTQAARGTDGSARKLPQRAPPWRGRAVAGAQRAAGVVWCPSL
jgi:hypothetical protein